MHFIRPFWTDDQYNQDLPLYPNTLLAAQVKMELPNEMPRNSYTTIVLPNLDLNKILARLGYKSASMLLTVMTFVFTFS